MSEIHIHSFYKLYNSGIQWHNLSNINLEFHSKEQKTSENYHPVLISRHFNIAWWNHFILQIHIFEATDYSFCNTNKLLINLNITEIYNTWFMNYSNNTNKYKFLFTMLSSFLKASHRHVAHFSQSSWALHSSQRTTDLAQLTAQTRKWVSTGEKLSHGLAIKSEESHIYGSRQTIRHILQKRVPHIWQTFQHENCLQKMVTHLYLVMFYWRLNLNYIDYTQHLQISYKMNCRDWILIYTSITSVITKNFP